MRRTLMGMAVVGLLVPLQATSAPAATSAVGSTLTVVREYGDGPVKVPDGIDRVRVVFHGRAGNRVRMDTQDICPVSLRRADGRRVPRSPSTFWRLPHAGRYVFTYRRCSTAYRPSLQLEKLVRHRLRIDGATLSLPSRRGYMEAAVLRVPAHGRIQASSTSLEGWWDELVLAGGTNVGLDVYSPRLFIEAGLPISDWRGPLTSNQGTPLPRVRAGDRLLLVPSGAMTVQATSAIVVQAVLDGPAVTVSNGGVPFRETQVEFDGVAGQWVNLERVGVPAKYGADPVLLDPAGRQLRNPTFVYHPYWMLPVSGHYRVMVPTSEADFTGTVRVRPMRLLPEAMPTDGSPLTFTGSSPGEWMLARFSLPAGQLHKIHLESATTTGNWSAFVDRESRYLCDEYSPLDCPTGTYAEVDSAHPDSQTFNVWQSDGFWDMVVQLAPGQTGSVTVSLPPGTCPCLHKRTRPDATGVPGTGQTRTVIRQYGDGPVRLGKATHLKMRFHGARGDRVRLDGAARCPVSLHGPGGRPVGRSWGGFWRVPANGRQTFTLSRCADVNSSSLVQLTKLRYVPVKTDGEGTPVHVDRGYVNAFQVRVPATGRLQTLVVRSAGVAGFVDGMRLPDGTWYPFDGLVGGETLYFEDGLPVATEFGRLRGAGGHGSLTMHAGGRITLVTSGRLTAYASVALPVPVTVDGPATTLPPSQVPYRQYQVEFDALAGSWVHTEWVAGELHPSLYYGPDLIGPSGHLYERTSFWRIPRTGRYRLMVPTTPASAALQLRIRTIRVLSTPMPSDGTRLTLSTAEAGDWVLAPMTLDTAFYRLSSRAVSATGAWDAVVTVVPELQCSRLSMGCGENSYADVSPDKAVSEPFGGYDLPWMVLLQADPDVTASVELSVSPTGVPGAISPPGRR